MLQRLKIFIGSFFDKDSLEHILQLKTKNGVYAPPDKPAASVYFEDLMWLFNTGLSNRGLLRMDLDEAAMIFKHVKKIGSGEVLEIGRFKGGSTVLLSSALSGGWLTSIDINSSNDGSTMKMLQSLGLAAKTELIVGDSRNYAFNKKFDLIFIDGDHSYEAVRQDFINSVKYLKNGGEVAFHDAGSGRRNLEDRTGVERVIQEIAAGEYGFRDMKRAGSLVILKK